MNGKFYSLVTFDDSAEIYIHSQIGKDVDDDSGIASGDFIQMLNEIPATQKINLHINSPGGSVPDGLAIYDALLKVRDRLTVTVDALCASMASVIACAGKEVIVTESSLFMVHKPWAEMIGNATSLRKVADRLDMWERRMIAIYKEKTGLDESILARMLKDETYLDSTQAITLGFADRLEKPDNMKVAAFLKDAVSNGFTDKQIERYKKFVNNNLQQEKDEKENTPMNENNNEKAMLDMQAKLDELLKANAALTEQKDKLEAEKAKARTDAIKAKVADAVKDGRIKNTDSSIWESILAQNEDGEKALASLVVPDTNARKEPGIVQEVASDLHALADHLKTLKGRERSIFRNKHKDRFVGYFNENPKASLSIDPLLKQDYIMGYALEEFKMITGPITKLFTTMFKGVPLKESGTDTVLVRYYPLFSQTAKQFYYEGTSPDTTTNPEGYGSGGEFAVSKRSITVDKRLKIEFDWTSYDLRRTPFFELTRVAGEMSVCLAWQVWNLIHSYILAANYAQKAFKNDIALANFSSDSIADVKLKCDNLQWVPGEAMRSLVLNSIFENQLLKDPSIKNYAASSTNDPLFRGKLPPMFGFKIYTNPNIPANGERLLGYACMPKALGIVNAPIEPDMHIPVQYDQATDPDTGMTLEARWWGSAQKDKAYCSLEFNCGLGVLEQKALVRLTETAASYNGRTE